MEYYCPICGRKTILPVEYMGKQKKCKGCGEIFALSLETTRKESSPSVQGDLTPRQNSGPGAPKKTATRTRVLVSAKEILSKSMAANMLKSFCYPSTGIVQFVFLYIAQIGFVAMYAGNVGGLRGLIAQMTIIGIICGYYFTIIGNSAAGRPYMPKNLEAFEGGLANITWVSATGMYLKLLGIVSFCGLPTIAYLIFAPSFNAIVCCAVSLPGIFLLPMALLAVAIHETILALNPVCLIAPLKKLFLPYLGVCLFFYGLIVVNWYIVHKYAREEVLAQIVFIAFSNLYCGVIAMHVLGAFYWCYGDRFGWFKVEPTTTDESQGLL